MIPGVELLVAHGCSFTYGDELRDPAASAWPRVAADALGVDVVNLALNGSSNRRIVRSTLQGLDDIAAERGLRPEQVLFVGMWTEFARSEYYDERRVYPETAHLPSERGWHEISHWEAKTDPRVRAHYRYLQSDTGDLINFLVDYVLLESFLKVRVYRYAFAFAGIFWPDEFPVVARSLIEKVDDSRLLGGWSGAASFRSLVRDRCAVGAHRHPLEEGHRVFALEHLVPWLESLFAARTAAAGAEVRA